LGVLRVAGCGLQARRVVVDRNKTTSRQVPGQVTQPGLRLALPDSANKQAVTGMIPSPRLGDCPENLAGVPVKARACDPTARVFRALKLLLER
jgi:hypothetical protein